MRNKYHIEGLREEIRLALLVVPKTRGQLDGFENTGCKDAKFAKTPHRDITNENGDRIISVKSEVVRTIACRQFKRSPMPLAPNAFKQCKLVRVMNKAPEHVSDWLKYCYGEGPALPTKTLLLQLLEEFNREEPKGVAASSKELIKKLALLACQQKRDAINTEKKLFTQSEVAHMAGKSQKTWEKTWAKRWNRFSDVLDKFDEQGLNHVYESQRREKSTRKHANVPVQSLLRVDAREAVATAVGL